MSNRKQYLLIIDGSSLLATSYYSTLPKALRKEKDAEKQAVLFEHLLPKDPQGRYINAVEKFFSTINTIETYQRPTHLVICWDSGRNTFRKEMWPKYKSNRSETPPPLKEQFQTAIDLCEQLGIPQVMDARYEADDFAGSIAKAMEPYMDVRILTRDKDYFQLITERTKIWYGMADLEKVRELRKRYAIKAMPSRVIEVDRNLLISEFGYCPESVPMIKALFGDVSDNIPGVSGMGENRSVSLAQHYYDLDALYRDIDRNSSRKGRENLRRKWRSWGILRNPYPVLVKPATPSRSSARDMARLCYVLGKIKTDIDLFDYLEEGYLPELLQYAFDLDRIDALLTQYNIKAVPRRRLRKQASREVRSARPEASRKEGASRRSSRRPAKSAKKGTPSKTAARTEQKTESRQNGQPSVQKKKASAATGRQKRKDASAPQQSRSCEKQAEKRRQKPAGASADTAPKKTGQPKRETAGNRKNTPENGKKPARSGSRRPSSRRRRGHGSGADRSQSAAPAC